MTDIERDLRDMMQRTADGEPHVPQASRGLVRRARLRRARTAVLAGAATAMLVIGGFAGARSLTNDEAVIPADEDSSIKFEGTWTTTDVEGRTRTLSIRASGEHDYELEVQNHLALFCSGEPSTLTGTARLYSGTSTSLTIPSPKITCDDGSEPKVEGFPSVKEVIPTLTFEYDAESDVLTNFSPVESRRIGSDGQIMYSGITLIWNRADMDPRVGEVSGWITYGSKSGIWARDLSSPADPSARVRLTSPANTLLALSPDGLKLLVQREPQESDVPPYCPACGSGSILNETALYVVNSDGTETRLTDASEGVSGGGSFSPDGTSVVYAGFDRRDPDFGKEGADTPTAIYVVDVEGGSAQNILTPGERRYPDQPGLVQTEVEQPKWSPDGSQIAFFDGNGDWGHSLRIMNTDGSDVRVIVENEATLGAGHVEGLEWSPDGSRLAFSIEGRVYVVGVDGSGFRLVTENGVAPYWSPDGSRIAFTVGDPDSPEGGTLGVVRLDDLEVQNFGAGSSGPWTAELRW